MQADLGEGRVNRYYEDILSRIKEKPTWFDEHAVPRYGAFSPSLCAGFYANQCVLLQIACQNCKRVFLVAMSWSPLDDNMAALDECVEESTIHYGDPPNVRCCPSGLSMNSIPHKVVEFWRKDRGHHDWVRDPTLERVIKCDWMVEDE